MVLDGALVRELVVSAWCGACGSGRQATLLMFWWSGGGFELAGQRLRVGGRVEEQHGVWCHVGFLMEAASSCKAGLDSSPWWIGFSDMGLVSSA